jgi:uncharacterized protein (TIRG00374 family)
MSKVSIVIPAHNEVENIPTLLAALIPVLEAHEEIRDFELVLVDDNSKDGTGRLIDSYAANDSRIKAVHRTDTPGFGNAVKTGLQNASGDILIPVMADLSDSPEDIPKLVRKINEGYDVAYGSRFCSGGSTHDYPWKKMIANRAFNNSVRLLFGIRHRDVTNAFKAYRRTVLEAIGFDNLEATGFDLTVEIPMKAHILGFSSAEVPVSWHERKKGEAKLKLSQNGQRYGIRLLKMFIIGNAVSLKDIFGSIITGSWIQLVIATILGLALLVGIFSLAGFSQIFSVLSQISLLYVGIACLMILITFILRTWRWSVLLRTSGHRIHVDTGFKCIMFGWFINYLLPLRIGDIARGFTLKTTEGTPLSIGLSTIVIERAMDMFTLAVILMASIFLMTSNVELFEIALISLLVSIALIIGIFIIYKYEHVLVRVLGSRFIQLDGSISEFKKGVSNLSSNPQAILLCIILSMPIWLFELLCIFFSARAIHLDLSIGLTVVAGITAFVMQAIPTTPAGIGVHEGTIAGVLMLFGINASIGTSIALVDHFARGAVIFIFGAISAIHIGFESRPYFTGVKHKDEKTLDVEPKIRV